MESKVGIIAHRPGKTKPSLWDIGSCKQKWYPHLYCIVKIHLTMPPSTGTAERSFNVLKRVKTLTRHNVTEKTTSLGIATYSQRHSAPNGCSRRHV